MKFYCTITGAPDGVDDVEVAMTNFHMRLNQDVQHYLNMTISTYWTEDLEARPNGELVIEVEIDGSRTEIERFDQELYNIQIGSESESIQVQGRQDTSASSNTYAISDVTYKAVNNGKWQVRAFPDFDFKPGDTAEIDSDSFTVGKVVYTIDPENASMELIESDT